MPYIVLCCLAFAFCLGFEFSVVAEAQTRAHPPSVIEILKKQQMTQEDLDEIFLRKGDDPQGLLRELFAEWHRQPQSTNAYLRARLGWLISLAWSDDFREDSSWNIMAVYEETIQLLAKEKNSDLLPVLRFYQLEHKALQGEVDRFQNSERLWAFAREIKDPEARAYALLQTAVRLMERGVSDEFFLRALRDARLLIPSRNIKVTPRNIEALDLLNIVLRSLGQLEEAEFISDALEAYCEQNPLRYICSGRLYEKGMELTRLPGLQGAIKAIPLFLKSIDLAESIQDKKQIAGSHYGLTVAYNYASDFKKAIEFGNLALNYYEMYGPKDWVATVWTELSIAYLGAKDVTKALDAVQKGLENCSPDFKNDRKKIFHQFSKVHEARGDFKEAFRYQSLYINLENETRTDESNKEYSIFRNKSLMKENELLAEQIQLLGKFRVVSLLAAGLSCIILLALVIVWRQSKELHQSRRNIKEILDHIDEGIAILDRNLKVQAGYSRYLDILFDCQDQGLTSRDLLDLVFADSNAKDLGLMAREVLAACIGEQELSWELNHQHLPNELAHKHRILALHWQPIFSASKIISGFLLSIRDVTQLRAIEQKMQKESERVQQIQMKLEEVLAGKVTHIRKFINDLSAEWSTMRDLVLRPETQPDALRGLHSWKGAARTLGLKSLATQIHEMESKLVERNSIIGGKMEDSWESLSQGFFDYQHLLNTIMVTQGAELSISEDLYGYSIFYAHEMRNRLDPAGIPWEGILVMDSVYKWKRDILPKIHEILLHAVANSIDHGFIRSTQSQQTMRSALIEIRAFCQNERVRLQVLDNGAGINWQKLRSKADEIGFVPKAGQSLTDLLFQDGVSTADSTSETSGRGVGLSAIHHLCLTLGGQISLESPDKGGTALLMEFPASLVSESVPLRSVS